MKKVLQGLAVLAAAFLLAACGLTGGIRTMTGDAPSATAPKTFTFTGNESTYRYMVVIYPGLDENFDPNPTLTIQERKQLAQLDGYCASQMNRFSGDIEEMVKQGLTYGGLEALFGAGGAKWAFGTAIKFGEYFKYILGNGFGGGLASGHITYQEAMAVGFGYCMTGMVWMADKKEGKLSRIWITPLYVGSAKLPQVSDRPEPKFQRSGREGYYAPLPPK